MITYRLAKEKDYKNINNFYNKINKTKRTLEEFYWLFHDSPFGKSIYIIAEDKNQIIGTNCVIPFDLIDSNKNIIKTGKSEDTLVDPKYRGQGIFYKIYEVLFKECQTNNIEVIWGFTSALKPFRKLGFKTPFSFQQSITTNNIFQAYKQLSTNNNNSMKKKIKILLLSTLSKVNYLINYNSSIGDFKLLTDKEIINDVDALIHSNLSDFNSSFSIHQNSNFQKWRIYNNPNYHKIHTFAFYDKNGVLKTLILLNSKPNGTANFIQTSFHSSLNKKDKIRLLNSVTNKMFKLGFYLLRNWIFNTNPINAVEKNTFKASRHIIINRGLSIVWKNLSDKNHNADDFYLSKIASQGNS